MRLPQAETYALKVKGEENSMDYRAFFNQASVRHGKSTCHRRRDLEWPEL